MFSDVVIPKESEWLPLTTEPHLPQSPTPKEGHNPSPSPDYDHVTTTLTTSANAGISANDMNRGNELSKYHLSAPGLELIPPPRNEWCEHNLPCGMCPHGGEPGCPDFNSTESESILETLDFFEYGPRVPYGLYADDADLDDYFRFVRRHPEYDYDDLPY